jgi:hypothetical protein
MTRVPLRTHADARQARPPRVTRLFSGGRHRWDDLGFLDIEQSPDVYRAEHLFDERAALIVGAPWLGKTTTARQLWRWLEAQPRGLAFGERLCLTEFGKHGVEQSLPPSWWDEWRLAAPAPPACWIIDALDEGEERIGGVRERILQSVGDLGDHHRGRLRLLIFSRQREWLAEFRADLGEVYELGPLQEVPEFHLAPPHQEAAREMLRAYPGAFDRVADLVRRFSLQPVAGYPVALDYLRQQHADADLTVVRVWRGLLQHLLAEPDSGRRRGLRSEADERFTAAARIAAVLTLTGGEQVVDHTVPPGLPALADVFPPGRGRALRQAAREACDVGPFLATAEGGYRFAQRNVQDWLAAFGLAGLRAAQLRSALCDGQGRPAARHRDLLPLLRQISSAPEVRDWIDRLGGGLPLPSDLVGPTLADSLGYIDRLEQVVADAPAGLWLYGTDLRRLAVPGLGDELARRLRDPERSAAVKDLLLDIARANDPYPALPAALDLVLDRGQPAALRSRALLLISQHGGDAHFRRLADPVGRGSAGTRDEQQLLATLIRHLLERRLWTIPEAAAHAPPAEPHGADDRHVLLHMIQERMSADDARTLLRDRQRLRAAPRLVLDCHHDLDLLQAALDRLLREERLGGEDEGLLVETALEWQEQGGRRDPGFAVLQRLGACATVRRQFYEHGIEARRCDPAAHRIWSFALCGDDWSWLLNRARGDWSDLPVVWEDLYRLARAMHEAGLMDRAAWEVVEQLVAQHAPGVSATYEQSRAAYERMQAEHKRRMQELERRRPPPVTLQEAVARVLREDGWTPADRMRELSWLCFVPNLGPANVTGVWEELDAGLQARILATVREGLEQGGPTPIPESSTFPGEILYEAWAFLRVCEDPEQPGWLTAERVRRWLPTAVFALHEHIPALMRRCAAIDQPAVVGILLDAAERELRRGSRVAAAAAQIPVEWWDNPGVAAGVTAWVQEAAFQVEARIELLGLLARHAPQCARSVAAAWSELQDSGSPPTAALRAAGLNCRLALDPEGTWPLVEADFDKRGAQALRDLNALQGHGRHGLCVDLAGWAVARLEALGRLLLRAYPVRSDPDREGRITRVTADTQLRDTRDRVFWFLYSRDDAEARATVERLAALDEGLAVRLRDYRARQAAEGILAGLAPPAAQGDSPVPLVEVIRLLDQAGYRLIRNADDLLEAVYEVLRQIEKDIPEDLAMLYGKRPKKKGAVPSRLNEDALQAYLRRRLNDLLPQRVQGFRGCILREDQVGYRRRLDLRVIAPCLLTGELATVVIEVKWSDNPETEISLTEQLGRKYLLSHRLTHGLYLVGWCGRWRRKGQAHLTDRKGLESYLTDQRDAYCRADAPGHGLSIVPVVLGLEWRDPAETN